jgi:hypothetical protein
MYGFENKYDLMKEVVGYFATSILFSGSKEELLSKSEEWFKGVLDFMIFGNIKNEWYRDYRENHMQDLDGLIHSHI